MDHNDIRHKLSEYIDDSVTPEDRAKIDAHLKTCQQCGNALEELRKTIEYVKTVEEVEPPTWMTQKIMANVRAEAEKKRWFQRYFLPSSFRLPIQAVAVVFLAVTAFAIYRSIQPVSAPSEAPQELLASRKEPAKDMPAAKAAAPSVSEKRVAQTPEYKSLDMKQEYERPAAPRLMDKMEAPAPTPAPAKPVEQPMIAMQGAASGKGAAAPAAGARSMMREESVSANATQPAEAKKKAMRQAFSATSTDKIDRAVIIVRIKNMETAVREFEQAITQLKGSITRQENPEAKRVYGVTIDAEKFPELKKKLALIGEMKDEAAAPVQQDGKVELRIELVIDTAQH